MDTTTTFASYAEAEQHITQHSGDGTYRLAELTAAHGEQEHEIRLDPTSRVIWWAYDNAPIGGDGWTVQRLTPADAARDADAQASLAEDRIEAGDYEYSTTTVEQDQDLLDEYAAILALSSRPNRRRPARTSGTASRRCTAMGGAPEPSSAAPPSPAEGERDPRRNRPGDRPAS